jgi:hypothetical protein
MCFVYTCIGNYELTNKLFLLKLIFDVKVYFCYATIVWYDSQHVKYLILQNVRSLEIGLSCNNARV